MEIITTYVSENGLYCGFKPKDVEIKEERQVLRAAKGYKLKKDDKLYSSVWLKDGDVKENYTEVEAPKKEEKKEPKLKTNLEE